MIPERCNKRNISPPSVVTIQSKLAHEFSMHQTNKGDTLLKGFKILVLNFLISVKASLTQSPTGCLM